MRCVLFDFKIYLIAIFFLQYQLSLTIYRFGTDGADNVALDDPISKNLFSNSEVDDDLTHNADQNFISDTPSTYSGYVAKLSKKPLNIAGPGFYGKRYPTPYSRLPSFYPGNVKVKTDFFPPIDGGNIFGGYYGPRNKNYGQIYAPKAVRLPIAAGPGALVSADWEHRGGYRLIADDVKPVTEDQPDDFKYDFRTKTHSIR
ncbi:uncharacterized protein LOC143197863 isoform X1 [Rhynchophorus ferrugineus]|uniref:uncharacterized protein LOC143197863 isoform X1 n=1 Tax=Rhynchophorus ferrugineus TaxID=354439 RepID=UPI003FCC7744